MAFFTNFIKYQFNILIFNLKTPYQLIFQVFAFTKIAIVQTPTNPPINKPKIKAIIFSFPRYRNKAGPYKEHVICNTCR